MISFFLTLRGTYGGEGGTKFERRKKVIDSWFVSMVVFSFFCVWFRLPGWSVGLYVVVAVVVVV